MTDLRQAAQQALEALHSKKFNKAVTILREALAQPEQEPTPWRDMVVVSLVREGINKHRARELADHFAAQPEQEPVAWMYQCTADTSGPVLLRHKTNWADSGSGLWKETPLYTAPPQRQWVGLTEDEKFEMAAAQYGWEDLLIAAEAKLNEKNK
jgi:hypothetical protein